MNKLPIIVGLFFCLSVVVVSTQQGIARADVADAVVVQGSATQPVADVSVDPAEAFGTKKCSFSSDCSHGKCKKNRCGGCSFTSDCKGWGKCGKGWCGACSFSSECKGFGSCKSGRCTKSPY